MPAATGLRDAAATPLMLEVRKSGRRLHGPVQPDPDGGMICWMTPLPDLEETCALMEEVWNCLSSWSGVSELLASLPAVLGKASGAWLVQAFRIDADGLPDAPPAEWWSEAADRPALAGLRTALDLCRRRPPDADTAASAREGLPDDLRLTVVRFEIEPGQSGLVLLAHPERAAFPRGQLRTLERALTQFACRHRVERSWADEVRFSQNVLELMGQGLSVSDRNGNLIFVNSAYQRLTQRSLAELIGSRPDHLAAPEDLPVLAEARRLRALGQSNTYEMTIVRPDGSRLPVLVSGVPRLVDGQPAGAIAVTTDLSALKEAERRTREALNRERALNLAKNSFMRLATHEYRNPVSSITYAIELLVDRLGQLGQVGDGRLTDRINRHARIIQDSAGQLNRLLDNLQLLWRLQSQDILLDPKPADVARLAEETVRTLGNLRQVGRIQLVAGPDLPGSFPLDLQLFRILLRNLLENALAYSPADLPVTVHLGMVAGGRLRVSVEDRGPGIHPEDAPNIFNSFYRGANAAGRAGSGVGLAIARLAARLHGGDVTLGRGDAPGSVFVIEIPGKPGEPVAIRSGT